MSAEEQKIVLIVEDDHFFREALRDFLKKKYRVLEANNGKSAREILSKRSIDVVLTDILMPGISGLELLEWCNERYSIPFVLMTGFSAVLETKSAIQHGAKGFLPKPFRNAELAHVIESVLQGKEPHAVPPEDLFKDYCKVSIDEFVSRPKADFDIFVRLSEEKMIRIVRKGQEVSHDKIDTFRKKGLKHLYILKDDFRKLIEFNLGLAKMITKNPQISLEKKMNFIKYTGEILLEKSFLEGVDSVSLNEAKSYFEITVDVLSDSQTSFDLLNLLRNNSDKLYAHSVGVSLYSLMIARGLGIESQDSLFTLSVAGLFHDMGKKEIPRELLERPRHLLSGDERRLIESHVVRGIEILNSGTEISREVTQIILEHHEDMDGMGYPHGKKRADLHPLSRVLQCANVFMDQTIGVGHTEAREPKLVLEHIEKVYGSRIDEGCMIALKNLFRPS